VCAEVAPVVEKLWGAAGAELTRARVPDARKPLAVTIAAREGRGVGAVLEALGAAAPVRAEKQSEWDIEVEELKRLLASGVDFVLIDVREPHEFEICNLGGELIPLGTLGGKLRELDREAHIVVHCRSGARSAKAVAALREAGFGDTWNLHGGILAWIERIDSSLTKY
jgi:adenylyltransferase/sulfurtransferase